MINEGNQEYFGKDIRREILRPKNHAEELMDTLVTAEVHRLMLGRLFRMGLVSREDLHAVFQASGEEVMDAVLGLPEGDVMSTSRRRIVAAGSLSKAEGLIYREGVLFRQ